MSFVIVVLFAFFFSVDSDDIGTSTVPQYQRTQIVATTVLADVVDSKLKTPPRSLGEEEDPVFVAPVVYPAQVRAVDLPARLFIPQIGVDASIVSVGLEPDGSMGTPVGPTGTAWFEVGPRPGEVGNAVIDGHFGWKDGIHAVFDELSLLRKGDEIYVDDGRGVRTTFVVREVRVYGETDDATDVFVSSDGKAHLNLITCGGIWNKDQKSYSSRTVVFADMK